MESRLVTGVGSGSRVLLHIGGAKVGSSSLQRFLTDHPRMPLADGTQLTYWTWIEGDGFRRVEHLPPGGSGHWRYYASTHGLPSTTTETCLHRRLASLRRRLRDDEIAVLSSELWAGQLVHRPPGRCSCADPEPIDIVLYVRPQTEWHQSAYFQWAVWEGLGPVEFLEQVEEFHAEGITCDWGEVARNAAELGGARLAVRYSDDVVSDFCRFAGYAGPETTGPRANTSIGLDSLALLLRHRSLRPGMHDSEIDFILEDLKRGGGVSERPLPRVITRELADRITSRYRESNEFLLSLCTPTVRADVLASPAWWSAPDEADPEPLNLADLRPSPAYLEEILAASLRDRSAPAATPGVRQTLGQLTAASRLWAARRLAP